MPEQEEIPMEGKGVARKKIDAIEKQAQKVSDLCETRMKAAEKEREARATLLALLDEHELQNYRLADGRLVFIDDKRKAKIKSSDGDEE